MARGFNGADEYLEVGAGPISALPYTFGCWWRPADDSTESEFFYMGDLGSFGSWYALGSRSDGSDFRFRIRVATSSHEYVWGGILTASTWFHCLARLTDYDDVDAFTNGSKVDGTPTIEPNMSEFDRVCIGRLGDATPSNYAKGDVAEAAIWNVALTDAEIALLADGYSPLFVRPQSLVDYWPLIRDEDTDRIGGLSLADYNTPTVTDHPPIIYPSLQWAFEAAAAAGPQTVTLDALTLSGSVPSASVTPGAVTTTIDTLTLAGSVPSSSITPGAVTTTIDTLTLASSVPSSSITPGAVTTTLDALTLAGSVPSASVVAVVTVTLDALTLAGSVPSSSLILGATTVTLDALTLAGSVPSASAVGGAITVTLDALTLAGSVPASSVTPGAVTVTLDALTLAGSVPNLSVTGDVVITLDTLTLASTLLDLEVTRGAKKALKGGWPFWRF